MKHFGQCILGYLIYLTVVFPISNAQTYDFEFTIKVLSSLVQLSFVDHRDETIVVTGILIGDGNLILTQFDEIDRTRRNFDCDDDDRESIQVEIFMSVVATQEDNFYACWLRGNFYHNYAILQLESFMDREVIENMSFPSLSAIDVLSEDYLDLTDVVTALYFDRGGSYNVSSGAITSLRLIESDNRQHRHYFADILELDDSGLGAAVLDAEGRFSGMVVSRNQDRADASAQLVQILPMATICRVDAELCDIIAPNTKIIPEDRTTPPPDNVRLLNSAAPDLEENLTFKCGIYGMTAIPADAESGWECSNNDNTNQREITVAQVDDVCKELFGDLNAFAMQSGSETDASFQWRCYTFIDD